MGSRSGWSQLRDQRMAEPGASAAYEAAKLAHELGRGGTVPTLPVLERVARALDVELAVEIRPRAADLRTRPA